MDEIDVAICRSLFANVRRPYSELGKELGLTPQAVHRRVQAMMEAGIIRGTVARLTPRALGMMWVLVHGWSRAPVMGEMASRLLKSGKVVLILVASGNYIYVHSMARDTTELAGLVSFVQREAQVHEAQVGLVPTPPAAPEGSLSGIDLRLLSALQKDARLPVADLAEEAGTTAKTAKRRLDRMVGEGLVGLSIKWQPDLKGDIVSYLHLSLRPGADREKVALLLVKKYSTGMMSSYAFSNLPNQLLVLHWSRNVREMQRACAELEGEGHFASVVPNILREVHYCDDRSGGARAGAKEGPRSPDGLVSSPPAVPSRGRLKER